MEKEPRSEKGSADNHLNANYMYVVGKIVRSVRSGPQLD